MSGGAGAPGGAGGPGGPPGTPGDPYKTLSCKCTSQNSDLTCSRCSAQNQRSNPQTPGKTGPQGPSGSSSSDGPDGSITVVDSASFPAAAASKASEIRAWLWLLDNYYYDVLLSIGEEALTAPTIPVDVQQNLDAALLVMDAIEEAARALPEADRDVFVTATEAHRARLNAGLGLFGRTAQSRAAPAAVEQALLEKV